MELFIYIYIYIYIKDIAKIIHIYGAEYIGSNDINNAIHFNTEKNDREYASLRNSKFLFG